jgi:hypothetical protein
LGLEHGRKAWSRSTFWYFLLTIHNTTTSQARSLFRVIAVFISFAPGAPLLQLRQLLIFAAAAARAPTPPRRKYQKKEIACSVGVGVWACL